LSSPILSSPTSSPFPYTTLFRSLDLGLVRGKDDVSLDPVKRYTVRTKKSRHGTIVNVGRTRERGGLARTHETHGYVGKTGKERIDRKSTRLNSSHQIISYAVFCL